MGKHGGRGVGSDGGMGGGLGGGVVCVCGESVDLGGAGARQVDHGEGHTDRRVVRRSPRLQVCDGGPDARRGERGAVARTGVGPGWVVPPPWVVRRLIAIGGGRRF